MYTCVHVGVVHVPPVVPVHMCVRDMYVTNVVHLNESLKFITCTCMLQLGHYYLYLYAVISSLLPVHVCCN